MADEKKPENKPLSEIFIGNKQLMSYVTSVMMQFNSGAKEISIKARGKYINRAVDVAEVVRNRFLQDVKVKDIKIGSEEFEGKNGKNIHISTIEIVLTK